MSESNGKAKSNGKAPVAVLDVPVEFGGVSIGGATARLGIRIDRSVCTVNAADDIFCGHRLTGRVVLGGSGDQPGQGKFMDDVDHMVGGVFDVKRFGANQKQITVGLTFSLADVEISELAKFSKGSGRLVIDGVGELPEEVDDGDGEDSGEAPGTLKADGPWRDVALSTLFHGALLKSLKEADLKTVGDLANFTATEKRLTDLEGIGQGKAAQIEDRLLQFWQDNPNADQPTKMEAAHA